MNPKCGTDIGRSTFTGLLETNSVRVPAVLLLDLLLTSLIKR